MGGPILLWAVPWLGRWAWVVCSAIAGWVSWTVGYAIAGWMGLGYIRRVAEKARVSSH